MKIAVWILMSILLFTACKEKVSSVKEISLEDEVIAIHDEVMPKMGDLHVAKKKLRSILDSTTDENIKIEILNLISNLEKADEGMMDWMANWNVPEKEPEMTKYLKSEKEKITKVKVDMLSSLKEANSYITK